MSPAARARVSELLPPELKPYLTYSVALHLALAFAALRLLGMAGSAGKSTVYTIDFVGGPASVITSAGPSAPAASVSKAPPAAPKPAPSGEYDEFGRRKGKKTKFVLPRPSMLRGAQAPGKEEEAPQPGAAPSAKSGGEASSGAPGDSGASGVSADMPNFPYPWYISRVRQLIWSQWQSRMPRGAGEAVIVFSLLPNGSVVDLRTETSSGDSAFDVAAMAAVQDAGPYPPLPPQFTEPFLKVHVTLRSQ